MNYSIEKDIWTLADYEIMGWHDSRVYQYSFSGGVLKFDLDYIFKWNDPAYAGLPYTFWISPVTLVFAEVKNLEIEVAMTQNFEMEVADITMDTNGSDLTWLVDTHSGMFRFFSPGYQQFIRQVPSFQYFQNIPFDERGGISLATQTYLEILNVQSDEVKIRKERELEQYTFALARHSARNDLKALDDSRKDGTIELKSYLVRKKQISQKIDEYDLALKSTRFEGY